MNSRYRLSTLPAVFCWFMSLVYIACSTPAIATDAFHGKVVAVESAALITFEVESKKFEFQLAGIVGPKEPAIAAEAIKLISKLVLDKSAYVRIGSRTASGRILVRLLTEDPSIGAYDVAVELVRAGLVHRQEKFDFKYDQLAAAEREAKQAKRGLWSGSPRN